MLRLKAASPFKQNESAAVLSKGCQPFKLWNYSRTWVDTSDEKSGVNKKVKKAVLSLAQIFISRLACNSFDHLVNVTNMQQRLVLKT